MADLATILKYNQHQAQMDTYYNDYRLNTGLNDRRVNKLVDFMFQENSQNSFAIESLPDPLILHHGKDGKVQSWKEPANVKEFLTTQGLN